MIELQWNDVNQRYFDPVKIKLVCDSLGMIPMTEFPISALGDIDDDDNDVFHPKTMSLNPIQFRRCRSTSRE